MKPSKHPKRPGRTNHAAWAKHPRPPARRIFWKAERKEAKKAAKADA